MGIIKIIDTIRNSDETTHSTPVQIDKPMITNDIKAPHKPNKGPLALDRALTRTDANGAPITPAITYSVKYKHDDVRYDGAPYLLVLVDPVDLRSDGFKPLIRLVIDAITQQYGKKVNIDIFDDPNVLEAVNNSDEINKKSGKRLSKSQYQNVSRHSVAMYVGQESSMANEYELSFFPSDWGEAPEIDKYRSNENYEPQ